MIRWLFACAMLMLTSAAVFSEPDTGDLFDLCPPDEGIRLVIESLHEDAMRGDLTEESIQNAAESRLRAAGIYDPEAAPYLYINVIAGSPKNGHFQFYAIGVEYRRVLLDDRALGLGYRVLDSDFENRLYGFATTWDIGGAGQGDSSYILSNLSRFLDKFLVEYLRVRDSKACQDLRAEGRPSEKRRTFDFSTLPQD